MEHPKAKDRNSGIIMADLCVPVQVPFVRDCEKLFSGGAQWREKFHELGGLLEELREEGEKSEARREQLEQENRQLRQRVAELEIQLAQPQPVKLPLGDVPRRTTVRSWHDCVVRESRP